MLQAGIILLLLVCIWLLFTNMNQKESLTLNQIIHQERNMYCKIKYPFFKSVVTGICSPVDSNNKRFCKVLGGIDYQSLVDDKQTSCFEIDAQYLTK